MCDSWLQSSHKHVFYRSQQKIEEEGSGAVYEATKTISRTNGQPVQCDAIGYRNGLGRVVLMRTNITGFGVGEVELVPSLYAPKKDTAKHYLITDFETNHVTIATTTQGIKEDRNGLMRESSG